eukprot:596178-Prymnesium_polylepis.1
MYDPELDGSYAINKGFRQARQLLLDISRLGLPAGCIYLDTISPQVAPPRATNARSRPHGVRRPRRLRGAASRGVLRTRTART